jgi:hypothetical protein
MNAFKRQLACQNNFDMLVLCYCMKHLREDKFGISQENCFWQKLLWASNEQVLT